jgi:hypothetical protein
MHELTEAERIFVERMVPHIEGGKSFEDAAAAVLEDDERLFLAVVLDSEQAKGIRSEISAAVYRKLRGER